MSMAWIRVANHPGLLGTSFKIAAITLKTLQNRQPSYLADLIIPYIPTRNLRSLDKNLLTSPIFGLPMADALSPLQPHLSGILSRLHLDPVQPCTCFFLPWKHIFSPHKFVALKHVFCVFLAFSALRCVFKPVFKVVLCAGTRTTDSKNFDLYPLPPPGREFLQKALRLFLERQQ